MVAMKAAKMVGEMVGERVVLMVGERVVLRVAVMAVMMAAWKVAQRAGKLEIVKAVQLHTEQYNIVHLLLYKFHN